MEQFLRSSGVYILTGAMVGSLAFVALAETLFPVRKASSGMLKRWIPNLSLAVINHFILRFCTPVAALLTAHFSSAGSFGLLNHLKLDFIYQCLISVVAMDGLSYLIHRLSHKMEWLWRIHAVHHSDTEVDFTTNYRGHPIESVIGIFAPVPVIALLGLPLLGVLTYQILSTVITIFSHANLKVPTWLDRAVGLVFVTPNFHRVHHCSEQRYTDSNFGNVLTCFDLLFGTDSHRPSAAHSSMELGLEYFRGPKDSRLDRLLMMPLLWPKRRS